VTGRTHLERIESFDQSDPVSPKDWGVILFEFVQRTQLGFRLTGQRVSSALFASERGEL